MKKFLFVSVSLLLLFSVGCASVPVYSPGTDLSTEAQSWGFVRRESTRPEVDRRQAELLESYGGFYIDENEPKKLYLTFDEGYENGYTSKILDTLQAKNVKAAFFVTGPYLEAQEALIKRIAAEGHIIGNHTVNHINMAASSEDTVRNELNSLNSLCEDKYGITMHYLRPPEGVFSEKSLAVSQELGYKTILWSFAYADWDINNQNGSDYAFSQVTPYLHNGAIILLHAVSQDNAEALSDIIDYARNCGYEFASLDELS